jgi:hypothetical protein
MEQDNGGKIVQLEKFADVLIADHARKDCPPGSVSWKYINDCVAAGELVNIEDYRVQQPQVSISGSGARTLFTKLDEQILVTWVKKAGAKTSGNEIYKDLAKLVGTTPKTTSQQQRPMLMSSSIRITVGVHGETNGSTRCPH